MELPHLSHTAWPYQDGVFTFSLKLLFCLSSSQTARETVRLPVQEPVTPFEAVSTVFSTVTLGSGLCQTPLQDHLHGPLPTFFLPGEGQFLVSSTPWPGKCSEQGESLREGSSAPAARGAQKAGAAEVMAEGRADGAFVKQAVSILRAGLSRSQHTEGQQRQLGTGVAVNFAQTEKHC